MDEYDDTTFNARQAVMVIAELGKLPATEPLIALTELLLPAPGRPHHRRLIFSGD
ncbi:hypothetical protein KOI35_18615 [Actinoplanes bogorensis]|uniref:Uncharacterized protein n=1 Tax=Paractinoplanes bogorensis TaxID=1610840 RepID=A0ABS5YQ16_9ACTN|nr:hypothetical protein [Actinoplanes bogorensis]MBU2665525.1 hypothetical protein [Actinoplanes bogorensis]